MKYTTYLNQFPTLTEKPTLNAVRHILRKLGNPQNNMKAIHIAGTNAKGSVAAYLNEMMSANKITFGKFVSPFLVNFNETITVNNVPIENSEIEAIIEKIDPIVKKYEHDHGKVKWFEINFLIAIMHFQKTKCEYIIIEAGLGGLNDATNVLKPVVSVITSIGIDHQDLLGRCMYSIAKHKAGIIKANTPVVIPSNIRYKWLLQKTAKKHNSRVIVAEKKWIVNPIYNMTETQFDYKGSRNIITPILGMNQPLNVIIAIETYKFLMTKNKKLLKSAIFAVKNTIHPGRFEIISIEPNIIYDGAHNIDAIKNFIKTKNLLYKGIQKTIIVSIIKTKKYKPILKALVKDKNANFIFTDGTSDKFYQANELFEYAKKIDKKGCFEILEFAKAIKEAKKMKTTFIVGSFYSYAKAIEILK